MQRPLLQAEHLRAGIVACVLAACLWGGLRLLPEAVCVTIFCRVPAWLAAGYYNVRLLEPGLIFATHHVTLSVARSCAATDFFVVVSALLAWGAWMRRNPWQRVGLLVVVVPAAWAMTVLANTARLILLVPATAWMRAMIPPQAHALGHQTVGVFVFLTCLTFIWMGVTHAIRNKPGAV